MKDWNALITLTGILCLTALAIVALANGIDGMILAGSMAIIGGLAGFTGKVLKDKLHGHKK